jgi:hypothetical protein
MSLESTLDQKHPKIFFIFDRSCAVQRLELLCIKKVINIYRNLLYLAVYRFAKGINSHFFEIEKLFFLENNRSCIINNVNNIQLQRPSIRCKKAALVVTQKLFFRHAGM